MTHCEYRFTGRSTAFDKFLNSIMTTYYSTFTTGLSEVAKNALVQQLKGVTVDLLLDGLIVYQSDRPLQQIKRIRFFNNTYLLLHLFNKLPADGIPFMFTTILKKPVLINIPRWAVMDKIYFRIMASRENQTVSIDRDILARLESFFSHKLNMKVNRSKPDIEIWFLQRSEGYGFVSMRITQAASSEKKLLKGELKPELANLLCLISEPEKEDVFLDPFAGSGAIPIERAKAFPYRQIIANDRDKEILKKFRRKISATGLKMTVAEWDALDLKDVGNDAVDKIVTDPPWGIYALQDSLTLENLYSGMLLEFRRVLKDGGIAVILMGQKDLFENILESIPDLLLMEKYDILVSGKKAAIYKIKKHPV